MDNLVNINMGDIEDELFYDDKHVFHIQTAREIRNCSSISLQVPTKLVVILDTGCILGESSIIFIPESICFVNIMTITVLVLHCTGQSHGF